MDRFSHWAAERGATEELIAHARERIGDFQRLADLAGVDLVITDATTGAFLDCNTSAHEALGYSREELLNLNPGRIQADPDHDDAWVAERMRELRDIGQASFQTKHRCKDGSVSAVLVNSRLIAMAGQPVIVSIVTTQPLTNQQQRALQTSLALLENGEHLSKLGTWDFRFSDGRVRWSRQTHRICKTDPDTFIPTLWAYGALVHPDDRDRWRREFQQAANRGETFSSRHRLAFLDGTETLVLALGKVSYDDLGDPVRLVGTVRDVSGETNIAMELEQARKTDPLTHLPNKPATQDELDRRLQGRGYSDSLAVLSLDVDGFQEINDNFGSAVGDQLLQAIARRLPQLLGPQAWIARFSSDQFLVLLDQDISSVGDAMAASRQLQLQWSHQKSLVAALDLHPSFCIGIASYPEHGQNSLSLLQCANTALTEAKRSGRGQICSYSTTLSRQIHERMELGSELAQAIQLEQLRLVVQPQNHQSGRLVGGEVLLRWTNRRGVHVPPSQFIPLAEESGLIFQLSSWVLERVLGHLRRWRDGALTTPRIALNVSPRELEVPGRHFVSAILDALSAHGLGPEQLELEITETALLRNPLLAREQLRVLADQGFRLAIDDFGTGYSSLELLRHLPVHRLKIDRTFVQAITASPEDQAIVQATITLARGLGMDCIAEGVETEEQRQRLEDLGCEHYQGYLFSRPLELEAFERLLHHHANSTHAAVLAPTRSTRTQVHLHGGPDPLSHTPSTFEQLELLRSAIDSAQDNFLLMRSVDGPDGSVMDLLILEANQAACRYMQQEREAIVGQLLLAIFPQMQANGLFDIFSDAITRGTPAMVEDFVYANHELLKDERVFDIQLNPSHAYLSVTWRDVTERHQASRSLAESAALYRLLAESIVEVVVFADSDERIRWVSPSLEAMTGWKPAQWQGRRFRDLFVAALGRPDPVDLNAWLADYGNVRQGRLRLRDPHKGWCWVDLGVRRVNGHGLRGIDPIQPAALELQMQRGFVITLQPVDEQVQQERRLQQMANTDSLTGLESRASILAWLDQRLMSFNSSHAQPVALLFCDFDDFKAVNDTYGHGAGDAVLKTVGERLRTSVRSHDRIGRLGGDEFLVVLEGIGEKAIVLSVARKLMEAIAIPIPWADRTIQASLSIGAAIHHAGEDAELFLKRADRSMYAAKKAGRHRVMAL